ncbi:hypothetical protein JZ751_018819 [Albula glossodonta]|uniref:Uncharacterized protein n=1 Tax=Albula glossodonta TaxID=121402 RepID=A0A8T2NLS8_9TELE|nr:hypothetical protein JZ751_018819 [Albula glossodonta]
MVIPLHSLSHTTFLTSDCGTQQRGPPPAESSLAKVSHGPLSRENAGRRECCRDVEISLRPPYQTWGSWGRQTVGDQPSRGIILAKEGREYSVKRNSSSLRQLCGQGRVTPGIHWHA